MQAIAARMDFSSGAVENSDDAPSSPSTGRRRTTSSVDSPAFSVSRSSKARPTKTSGAMIPPALAPVTTLKSGRRPLSPQPVRKPLENAPYCPPVVIASR